MISADFSDATLPGATLDGAMMPGAVFDRARFRETSLVGANLKGASLAGADMTDCKVSEARMLDVDLRGAVVRGVFGYRSATWLGARIVGVDFCGSYLLRRHIMDENYLDEFRRQSPTTAAMYWVWWVTSDCWRSLVRWGALTAAIAVIFAGLYGVVDINAGDNATVLSPLYFSIVTLTTLGYGDVLPTSLAAQIVVMVQVVIGYVMLGGLLSIFANKMARRAT
jgi:hypothetical protein